MHSSRESTRRSARVIGGLYLVFAATTAGAQSSYLDDLGAVAPALGINNSGQVVLQNYLYTSGSLTAFPSNFTGAGINAGGQIVGSVATGPTSFQCTVVGLDSGQACAIGVYASGTLTTYPIYNGSLDPAVGNQGQGINASGQIVGDWTFLHGVGAPIELVNGVFSEFHVPGSTCGGGLSSPAGAAYAINDSGQIAGILPGGPMCQAEAFLYSQGSYYDIGAGSAYAINASGQVTGSLALVNTSAAFLYTVGGMPIGLGTLGSDVFSSGYAVNASEFVVGTSESATNSQRAFYYDGVMLDLNTFMLASDPLQPFVTLTDARGINDTGLVVVNGTDSRTHTNHAYLLQVPLIQVAPGPLSFQSQTVGSTSSPQTLTFTNAGTTSLALGGATISAGFTIRSNSCGSSLASAATCIISVASAPTAGGNPTGAVTLAAAGVPIAVPLSATATYPAVTASISASPTTVSASQAATLTWTSTNATSCVGGGGGSGDGWAGNGRAATGSVAITEPNPPAAGSSVTLTFSITCTSSVSNLSATSSVKVVQNAATAPSGGHSGGGTLDTLTLMFLLGTLALRYGSAGRVRRIHYGDSAPL